MTLIARADVMSVSVPVTSGGCGQTHSRPVVNGAPVKTWELDCLQCEADLRQDIARSGAKKVRTQNPDAGLKLGERYLGLWGTRHELVPETYNEEIERVHAEQETAKNQAASSVSAFQQIGDAIAKLADQGQGNNALVQALAQALTAKQAEQPVLQGVVEPDGPRFGSYVCQGCGSECLRTSNKGPAPKRCPDCKAKAAA